MLLLLHQDRCWLCFPAAIVGVNFFVFLLHVIVGICPCTHISSVHYLFFTDRACSCMVPYLLSVERHSRERNCERRKFRTKYVFAGRDGLNGFYVMLHAYYALYYVTACIMTYS